jgi:zinc protease
VPTLDEEMAEIRNAKVDDVKRFYARFVGGASAELAIVGDFDPAATRALVTELFGSWKSPSPYTRVPNPYRAPAPTVLTAETSDKANATMFAKVALRINDKSDDLPALIVVDRMLGASTDSRIPDRVREKEGLSYSIQTWLSPNSFEENSQLNMYAIFAPQNRDRLNKAIGEELARALKDGFTDAELADAKRSLLQARRIARAQDPSLAGGLLSQAYLGRTWDYAQKIDAGIAAVTLEQAKRGAAQVRRSAGVSVVVRGRLRESKALIRVTSSFARRSADPRSGTRRPAPSARAIACAETRRATCRTRGGRTP